MQTIEIGSFSIISYSSVSSEVKMKITIIVCCVLGLGSCGAMKIKKSSFPSDFTDMVKQYGYQVESYDVQTEDGYILELFRMPNGRRSQGHGSEDDKSSSSSSEEDNKRAVFLMHGMMSSAESFVYGGPTEGMAFYLADAGYDVYLGNARGSLYGQRHTTLDPKKDAAFWRFCWDEIGTRDLPALLNKALSVSGQSRMSYIGHNEGTTSFYVMASQKPEYNQKLDRQLSLGPMAIMKNSNNEIFETIESHYTSKSWIMKNMGMNSFSPSRELTESAESNCLSKKYDERFCKNVYFLINGYNSKQMNQTTMNQVLPRMPAPASVREILHFVQLKTSGRFQKYTEDNQGEEYDMSKITVPVALFYTSNDPFYNRDDIQQLADKLPNVYKQNYFENLDNNLDLVWSENMEKVFEKVKNALEEDVGEYNNLDN